MAKDGSKKEVPPWLFDNAAELSKHVRTLHTIYIGFLIYCVLFTFSTSDKKILLNEEAHLPIINADLPFYASVIIASAAVISIFVFFQLHVQMLREIARELKTKYSPYDKMRLSPWFMFFDDLHDLGLVGKINRAFAQLTLWLLPFVVLLLFVFLILRTHNLGRSVLEWLLSCCGSLIIWLFWFRHDSRGGTQPVSGDAKFTLSDVVMILSAHFESHRGKVVVALVLFSIYLFLLALILDINKLRPSFLNLNLKGESLVTGRREAGKPYVDLRGVDLAGANLESADLTKDDLTGVNLQDASLIQATLTSANLSAVNFSRAVLVQANLQHASLFKSQMTGANLNCADLSGVDFAGADLSDAFMMSVTFNEATNLTAEQLSKAITLYKQDGLRPDLLSQVEKTHPELFKEPQTEQEVERAYDFDQRIEKQNPIIPPVKPGENTVIYGERSRGFEIDGQVLSTSHALIRSNNDQVVGHNYYIYAKTQSGMKYLIVYNRLPPVPLPCPH